jgi:hypothetical protein
MNTNHAKLTKTVFMGSRFRGNDNRRTPDLITKPGYEATKSPDLPPDLRSKRTSVTVIPRSIALHMS